MKNIAVTGGAGYIGAHVVLELMRLGFKAIVVDNFCNSSRGAINAMRTLTDKGIDVFACDVRDVSALTEILIHNRVEAVLHLAGLKSVSESIESPTVYYENNVGGTLSLARAMEAAAVRTLIYSSSATIYGDSASPPVQEQFAGQMPTSPYGKSKIFVEEYLKDLCVSDCRWKVGVLRYFNPVGAHKSGMIGEELTVNGGNLMPQLGAVALGIKPRLKVFGGDYLTCDGTGVRDYIHVLDLASGHIKALMNLASRDGGIDCWNIGTGQGYTVLEVINAFQKVSGRSICYDIVERRAGDVAESFASVEKSRKDLNWRAERELEEMCEDAWRWYSKNPAGYNHN